ncbi:YceI family protein [Photobacterium atrarenae]|uniref:YceI family protein n=1 Tax=Photobacterium atrarenae TaxID=865757 RepID=A0ABY5GKA6_9GAMM|nr:YceI family protein [Photobacterium atrarenae]UTV29749.1 YceI family protein [Photobacterium atrarenae]
MRVMLHGLLMVMLLGVCPQVWAGWKLDNPRSNVNFLSVKNDAIIEPHYFRNISGSVTREGVVKVMIDLSSIDSQISIRDERMKKELFEVEGFPLATLTAKVDPALLTSMSPGKTQAFETEFTLDLHGKTQTLKARLQATGLENGGLLVSTTWPVILSSEPFGLDKGIEVLKNIANLNSILLSVPVNAQLMFVKS